MISGAAAISHHGDRTTGGDKVCYLRDFLVNMIAEPWTQVRRRGQAHADEGLTKLPATDGVGEEMTEKEACNGVRCGMTDQDK